MTCYSMHRRMCLTAFFAILAAIISARAQTIHSPNRKLTLQFALSAAGEPTYQLHYGQKLVLKPSRLAVLLQDQPGFDKGFTIAKVDSSRHDDTWTPVWGEVKQIRNHYQELAVTVQQAAAKNRQLVLRFRLFDDGLGFRYEFPAQENLKYFIVSDEQTEFNLPADHKAFWIPGDYDSNEYAYSTTRLSAVNTTPITPIQERAAPRTVQTPLMLKTDNGLYVNIHEAALVNYPAMMLNVIRAGYGRRSLWACGGKCTSTKPSGATPTPATSSWPVPIGPTSPPTAVTAPIPPT